MPRTRVPGYRHHKPSGQAVVTLGGRDIYLGKHGTPESHAKYDRLIARYLAEGRAPARPADLSGLDVGQVLLRFYQHAEKKYVKRGRPTGQLDRVKRAVACAVEIHGGTPAAEFGPKALKEVRTAMVAKGWCRRLVNQMVGVLKTAFTWAAAEELIGGEVAYRLRTVRGLARGELGVPESEPVRAASWPDLKLALPHLLPAVRDLALFQRWTGCRPIEACNVRSCDVNTEGKDRDGICYPGVWVYEVPDHANKTAHHGQRRVVFIGPRAQAVLRKYLAHSAPGSPCFSPAEARLAWERAKRAARKTKVQPSQRHRRKRRPKRAPGSQYSTQSYGRALMKACRRAGVTAIAPNQLRHLRATELRGRYNPDVARTVLGHNLPGVSAVYAEPALHAAAAAQQQTG